MRRTASIGLETGRKQGEKAPRGASRYWRNRRCCKLVRRVYGLGMPFSPVSTSGDLSWGHGRQSSKSTSLEGISGACGHFGNKIGFLTIQDSSPSPGCLYPLTPLTPIFTHPVRRDARRSTRYRIRIRRPVIFAADIHKHRSRVTSRTDLYRARRRYRLPRCPLGATGRQSAGYRPGS